ncbi:MAG: hypothetical protein AAB512_03235 [Patescibacteria group bacterium]
MRTVINLLITAAIILATGALIFWLWQRQPKGVEQKQENKPQITLENPKEDKTTTTLLTSPKDNDVVLENVVKFTGKSSQGDKILIISDSTTDVAATNSDGSFSLEEKLSDGLNLIKIVALDKDLKETKNQIVSFYYQKDTKVKNTKVIAGTVSKIFDNLITVSATSGDQNVRTNTQTVKSAPKPAATKSPTPPPKSGSMDIRVGDYVVALGNPSSANELIASSVEIIRDNKPQITTKYVAITVSSVVKSKIFSGNNIQDTKLVEFKLGKTNIIDTDKKADEKAIVKNKKAIIFYTTQNNENIVSLVYILP